MIFEPWNTAMARRGPSIIAKGLVDTGFVDCLPEDGKIWKARMSVLDWGCGKGADVEFYHRHQIPSLGFDPRMPGPTMWTNYCYDAFKGFDVVTCIYVLNTIPTHSRRVVCLQDAERWINPHSAMIVAARSKSDIDRCAKKGGWKRHGDGYISSKTRRTFQHGMTPVELANIMIDAGLCTMPIEAFKLPADVVCLIGRRMK